jgi:acyl transferase domain-containing protein
MRRRQGDQQFWKAMTMYRGDSAIVFAGQGTLQPAGLKEVAGTDLRDAPRALDTKGRIEAFLLGASLAHYRALRAEGARPAAFVGHSFGELSALVSAGAFTLEQAAEIALRRSAVLDRYQREPAA